MSAKTSGWKAATENVRQAEAAEAYPPDRPIPFSLTPLAEAALAPGDPEAEADIW